jgi:hypothetical protein
MRTWSSRFKALFHGVESQLVKLLACPLKSAGMPQAYSHLRSINGNGTPTPSARAQEVRD